MDPVVAKTRVMEAQRRTAAAAAEIGALLGLQEQAAAVDPKATFHKRVEVKEVQVAEAVMRLVEAILAAVKRMQTEQAKPASKAKEK